MVVELSKEEIKLILRALTAFRLQNHNPQVSIMGILSEERQQELSDEGIRLRALTQRLEGLDGH